MVGDLGRLEQGTLGTCSARKTTSLVRTQGTGPGRWGAAGAGAGAGGSDHQHRNISPGRVRRCRSLGVARHL